VIASCAAFLRGPRGTPLYQGRLLLAVAASSAVVAE